MKNFKNQKGITLVALVVTIIVLLILAGVTLSLVAGENGILGRATSAVDKNEIGTAKEQVQLLLADEVTAYYEARYVDHKEGFDNALDYILKNGVEDAEPTTRNDLKTMNGYTVEISAYTNDTTDNITVKGGALKSTGITGVIGTDGKIVKWTTATPETPSGS